MARNHLGPDIVIGGFTIVNCLFRTVDVLSVLDLYSICPLNLGEAASFDIQILQRSSTICMPICMAMICLCILYCCGFRLNLSRRRPGELSGTATLFVLVVGPPVRASSCALFRTLGFYF